MRRYDIVIAGGGHAGAEAAWAAASALGAGGSVALVTMDPSRIGAMSCNPAIGGLAKGQMVREIDALGGIMGLAADATGIQFKMLNTSKGPAVRGPRAQCDKYAYAAEVQRLLSRAGAGRGRIDVVAGMVEDLRIEGGALTAVRLSPGSGVVEASAEAIEANERCDAQARPVYPRRAEAPIGGCGDGWIECGALIVTTGTFLRAKMHTGPAQSEGGRVGEGTAVGMSEALARIGLELGRLKTGTPPRLVRPSIDWDALPAQQGDDPPTAFSDLSGADFPRMRQVECRVSSTTAQAHEVIRANLHRAPMYSGQVNAECGPRYCPSIEDKVVRFPDRESHHVFLEPESLFTEEVYANGISTSLPVDVQEAIVRSMPGCADARVLRWGYAVEYDMVWPYQIDSTCEVKGVRGLFLAGQINGTSGYEEAAAQGLVAGLNAARMVRGLDAVRLGRDEAYVGVLLDDLVVRTPREPYRMFTSRAEHRLLLRADNADERLTRMGREWGLVEDGRWQAFEERQARLAAIRALLADPARNAAARLARMPQVAAPEVAGALGIPCDALLERAITDLRYEGYVVRARADIRRAAQAERTAIPDALDPGGIGGLRREAVEALRRFRPRTVGQASRLAGVHAADVLLISMHVRRRRAEEGAGYHSSDSPP